MTPAEIGDIKMQDLNTLETLDKLMFDSEAMLMLQHNKYRSLQKSAPVGSTCWIAAKTTADETKNVIDFLATNVAKRLETLGD